jgi:peptide/nickel transport system substrate-binding protein
MRAGSTSGGLIKRRSVLKGMAASGALLGLSGRPLFAQSPKRGGTLKVAFIGSPVILDPALARGTEEIVITRQVYDALLLTDNQLRPQPELAETWESTPDATVWTFHLRKGVMFHHGREFDAEDVIYTFTRIQDEKVASPARSVFANIKTMEALDKYTVRFTLDGPFAEFPVVLGGNFQARIAPRDVGDHNKEAIGTGPFKLVDFVPGERTTFVRNEAYWKDPEPYLDEVQFLVLPEEASQVAGLTSGSLDMSYWPAAEVLPIYQANPDIKVQIVQTNGYQPIVMRSDVEPFNKPEVRRAFRLMCNREKMIQVVLGQLPVVPSNDHPIPPTHPYYMPQETMKQDIDEAKRLLAGAGYPDGLDIEMMAWTGRGGLVQEALAFQDMAKAANVRIEVRTVPADVFLGKYWLQHPFYVTNWNSRTTLYELINIAYQSGAKWNESHWHTPRLDELIVLIRSEQDEEKRKAIFAEVQQIFIDDSPVVIAYHRPRVTAARTQVQGFEPHPSAWLDLRKVWLG